MEPNGTIGRLLPIDIEAELRDSFIKYSMAVIINRALPDVRDGLKPVHRRILYSMHELGMTADKPFRKSARIVGDVLGKYHPHGDGAVYDAMVRLAQPFSTRCLLVDGQGNFGSVDGDGAAAMRYTEARMSKIAGELVQDLDKETVNFYPNFDESLMQPEVLPSRFPNLLVNGSGGIAVGMATNIPPHNLGEVVDGVIAMLDRPEITVPELMEFVKGPDFPTGGIIMGTSGIKQAYLTGRGRIVVRARTEIEPMDQNRSRIVVTEIPYQVNKARLVEKIAELVHEKRVEGISDLRDESDRNGMRIVIELKRDVNASIVLNTLFKHTQLQDTFGVIMLALVGREPKVLSLAQMIYHYIEHQKEVVIRRTRYELGRAEARAHIVEGLLKALDHIDEIIALIRASRTTAQARQNLMERFEFSEKQAQAILDMRLQRLTGLERERLEEEHAELMKTIAYLKEILSSDEMLRSIIKQEISAIKDKYADLRRTEIAPVADEIVLADMIEEEDVVVTLTHFGYVKRLSLDTYRAQRRGGKGITGLTTREEDFVEKIFITSTHSDLLFFTSRGRAFKLTCFEIPEAGRTARGTAIVNLLQLSGGEKVTAVIPVEGFGEGHLVMATREGLIKRTPLSDFTNIRVSGLIAINLREEDELIGVMVSSGGRDVLIGTRRGMSIRFSEEELRLMGRATMGVKSVELRGDDRVVSMCLADSSQDESMQILTVSEKGYGKRSLLGDYRLQSRGGSGVRAMQLTEKTGALVTMLMAEQSMDVLLISDDGTIIRMPVEQISSQGRNTQGLRLMRLGQESKVVALALAQAEEEGEEELAQEEMTQEPREKPETEA
ncbi:MAG: DNA gyrase subunit A [Christensenellaceae bacterium]|jgi:DNA gyrase subunit A|nr:DNA gyrase subunit A [Christensenellaceae bacterium]